MNSRTKTAVLDFQYPLINYLVEDINDNDNDSDYANGESEEIKPKKKKKGHYCTKGHATKILFKTLKSYNEHIKGMEISEEKKILSSIPLKSNEMFS